MPLASWLFQGQNKSISRPEKKGAYLDLVWSRYSLGMEKYQKQKCDKMTGVNMRMWKCENLIHLAYEVQRVHTKRPKRTKRAKGIKRTASLSY